MADITAESIAVAEALAREGISFAGPGVTRGGHRVYLLEGYIFTEAELSLLLKRSELNREGIGKLRASLEKKHGTEALAG